MAEKILALYLFLGSIVMVAEVCYISYDVKYGQWARIQHRLAEEKAWQARRLANVPTPEYLKRVHDQANEGRRLIAAYLAKQTA